jgi:ATP-dependent helicase YprA (DUF1998 family)
MTELLPTRQAADLRRAITDYVTTAISLADPSVARALDAFLTDEQAGIFLGPYVRTRLPFAGSTDQQQARSAVPSLPDWFVPYAHQARAFTRLSTVPSSGGGGETDESGFRLPEPTIVTTGTGSGKTESFLYPVLDHAARARAAGIGGVKALILYPMNALANDQAGRLATMITETAAYQGLTAALYTGEASHEPSTVVTPTSLITDREMIRGSAPDILLTNYKMLDQLLLRRADRPLWEASAQSLRYLVLDEFHTYDGAQGTDVGMLLRRLRLVLDSIAPGRVHLTPVATSATLGDGDSTAGAMLDFARTVFGTDIGPDAVITETRVDLDDFLAPAQRALGTDAVSTAGQPSDPSTAVRLAPVRPLGAEMQAATARHLIPGESLDADDLTWDVLNALWQADGDDTARDVAQRSSLGARDLLLAHPVSAELLDLTSRAASLADLARALFPQVNEQESAQDFTTALLAALSHERARKGAPRNSFPSLEAHFWLREISRVDRLVQTAPAFRWSDATPEDGELALPAIYCRHCGRSGWGAANRAVGDDLDLRPDTIRRASVEKDGRFRALILDVTTGQDEDGPETEESARRRYLDLDAFTLERRLPEEHDRDASPIRVLVHNGLDAEEKAIGQYCPACGEKDAIRFLGTRLATLLSVSLTSLFGTPGLDLTEKKALVFTDSVQDAAHRAGFVEARSYSITMRSVIRSALSDDLVPLPTIIERMLAAADTDESRYRLLHPTITDSDRIEPFWHQDPDRRRGYRADARRRASALVASRLAFDVGLELGLTGQVGRTLLLTGSAVAHVRAHDAELDQAAERALGGTRMLDDDPKILRRWVRGILERMRTHGAVSHDWLKPFRKDGGPVYRLWGGRPQQDVMPPFPTGRALPQLPSFGRQGERCEFEDVTSRAGWYVDWTARALSRDRATAASFLRPLFDEMLKMDLLDVVEATGHGNLVSFALRPDRIEAALPSAAESQETAALVCTECRETVTGTAHALAQQDGGPCPRHRCAGTMRPRGIRATYYRALYQGDMRRVVAREHTSLLETEDRLTYETEFKNSAETPGAPNVLVATPTLEMGIDIGDLSTVLLASVPSTVASYLQRVGRAGRKTGNALDVTFVAGRGRTAGLFFDPLDLIDGTVRSPGAYLSAQEILHRQLLASVMDTLAGDDRVTPPRRTDPVLASSAPGTFLGHVIEEMTRNGKAHVDRFLGRFATGSHSWDGLTDQARQELRGWALPSEDGGTSRLVETIQDAVRRWNASREELRRRRSRIQENLEKLENIPDPDERAQTSESLRAEDLLISAEQAAMGAPEATLTEEEREKERRSLRARAGQIGAEASALDTAHWIGVLERYALLPNFTLVDDSVALEATVIWKDDDGTWHHDPVSYTRSGEAALTDLAPGAHFYAHGRELVVDAVDIGVDGASLKPTAFCPGCGYALVFERKSPPSTCPQCHRSDIADAGQHRDVIDLTRVYSTMSRNRTRIGDARDDRERVQFERALSVSFHDAVPLHAWSAKGTGFGMALHRGTTLTRLNLGRPHQVAEKIRISGEDRSAPGFLLCAQCGHLDSDTSGNSPRDHQAWCNLRYEREGENRAALLSRTMQTETVLITLPPEILEDPSGELLVNLRAALQLGIATRFGGSIDNVDVDVISHPQMPGHKALLFSDQIVGGTGYLMELASAPSVWDLLISALDELETCPCANEGLAACHRCLLPYVQPDEYDAVRKVVAIEALHMLLQDDDPRLGEMAWAVDDRQAEVATVSESPLERRFRRAFIAAMESIDGASVTARGSVVSVRAGGRTFTLDAQVDVAGTRPDFVLTWPGSDVMGIAIFTDGEAFHASAGINRLADDAVKRMRLRRAGYIPLAVTSTDVDVDAARRRHAEDPRHDGGASGGVRGATPSGRADYADSLNGLLRPETVKLWAADTAQNRDLQTLLQATPLDLLVEVVRRGRTDRLQQLATELPQLLVAPGGATGLTTPPAREAGPMALDEVAAGLLRGVDVAAPTDPTRLAVGRRDEELAVLGGLTLGSRGLTLVLDDRDSAVRRDSFAVSWRAWLRLANLAQGDPYGTTLRQTTMSLVENGVDVGGDVASGTLSTTTSSTTTSTARTSSAHAGTGAEGLPLDIAEHETPTALDPTALPEAWREPYEDAITLEERTVILSVAPFDIEAPVVGDEFGGGIPLDIAWPDRKVGVVVEDLGNREKSTLENEGWSIVGPSTDDVLTALGLAGGAHA